MAKKSSKNNFSINSNLKKQQIIFLIVAALVSILLLFLPWLDIVAKIFNIFTTIIHETGHAIANFISGNTGISIKVDLITTGGITYSYGHRNIFTISAGYLGASLLGGVLLIISAKAKASNIILKVLGGFLILVALLFMFGHWLTFVVTLVFAFMFIIISLIKNHRVTFFFLTFLSIQLIINSISDIITLIRISFGETSYTGLLTDADNMAEITGGIIPSWIWAIIYFLMSIFIFIISFRINRKIISKYQ